MVNIQVKEKIRIYTASLYTAAQRFIPGTTEGRFQAMSCILGPIYTLFRHTRQQ